MAQNQRQLENAMNVGGPGRGCPPRKGKIAKDSPILGKWRGTTPQRGKRATRRTCEVKTDGRPFIREDVGWKGLQ